MKNIVLSAIIAITFIFSSCMKTEIVEYPTWYDFTVYFELLDENQGKYVGYFDLEDLKALNKSVMLFYRSPYCQIEKTRIELKHNEVTTISNEECNEDTVFDFEWSVDREQGKFIIYHYIKLQSNPDIPAAWATPPVFDFSTAIVK
jgi:hypothetical protein